MPAETFVPQLSTHHPHRYQHGARHSLSHLPFLMPRPMTRPHLRPVTRFRPMHSPQPPPHVPIPFPPGRRPISPTSRPYSAAPRFSRAPRLSHACPSPAPPRSHACPTPVPRVSHACSAFLRRSLDPSRSDDLEYIPLELMYDLLHLTPTGYTLWADCLTRKLAPLLDGGAAGAPPEDEQRVRSRGGRVNRSARIAEHEMHERIQCIGRSCRGEDADLA